MKNTSKLILGLLLIYLLAACANNALVSTPTSDSGQIATIVAATLSANPSPSPTATSIPTIAPTPESNSDIKWLSYLDPKFGFTIDYPTTWIVKPNEDISGSVGGSVDFRYTINYEEFYTIQISHHNESISATDSLSEWTDRREAEDDTWSPDDIKTVVRQNTTVDGLEAYFIRGASPLGEYQFTNIRMGETVWFIWANFGETADKMYLEIYEHMVKSLKFSPNQ